MQAARLAPVQRPVVLQGPPVGAICDRLDAQQRLGPGQCQQPAGLVIRQHGVDPALGAHQPQAVLAALHLLNIFTFLLFEARVQAGFLTPLFLLSAFIPTNTGFTAWIPGYLNLFLLPVLSLLLVFFGAGQEKAADPS